MGSMTPWYESMFIHFGAKPVTIDYNRIILCTERMAVMTIDQWERERPVFDVGFSISSLSMMVSACTAIRSVPTAI
jgi:hypothetical protein